MITIEEGSVGGFAAHVMQFLALEGKRRVAWDGISRGRGGELGEAGILDCRAGF